VNASDVLKYGQSTLLRTFEAFPQRAWDTPGACGYWSVKDIIAHLASYELVLVDVLASCLNGSPTPVLQAYLDLGHAWNDTEVNKRKRQTVQENLAELAGAHERSMALVVQIAPGALREPGSIPWYGREYALDDLIVYQYYGHKREHSAQIAAMRDLVEKV
jgi:hypothetical protein